MKFNDLDRLSAGADRVLKPYLEKLAATFNEDIVSVIAYGGATTPGYDSGGSSIDMAVVLKDTSIYKLKPALRILRGGLKKKITVPLFLTRKYIEMSLDTFPIEFMEMRDTQVVLFGEDVLSSISVSDGDIRRECEYQIKGKLITLRQAYLEQALKPKALERLVKVSLRSLMPVFRNALRIKIGKTPSLDKAEILCGLSEEFGVDVAPFLEVIRDEKMNGRIGETSAEIFIDAFITQLERLSEVIDKT